MLKSNYQLTNCSISILSLGLESSNLCENLANLTGELSVCFLTTDMISRSKHKKV